MKRLATALAAVILFAAAALAEEKPQIFIVGKSLLGGPDVLGIHLAKTIRKAPEKKR